MNNAEQALQEWIKTQTFTVSGAEQHGFINGYNWSLKHNNPVAWINRKGKDGEHGYLEWDKDDLAEVNTPLYTHPVKEMSETRIKQIFVEQTGFYFDDNPADDLALMDFAKALLLEAQEK